MVNRNCSEVSGPFDQSKLVTNNEKGFNNSDLASVLGPVGTPGEPTTRRENTEANDWGKRRVCNMVGKNIRNYIQYFTHFVLLH